MPLVGRDEEVAVLTRALALAHDGQPQVVWLQGEAGAGKSTLVQRVVDMAASDSAARCSVWRVTCDLAERTIEYGVARQLLMRARAADDEAPDPARYGELLLDAIAASKSTVLLIVDDLHWCDLSSLQMLRYVLRRLDGSRAVVLLAHRPMDQWVDESRRASAPVATHVLKVRPLGVDGVRVLASRAGVLLTQRAAARLHEHTGGNPQLVATVLAEVPAVELTSSDGPIPAPNSFTEWVQAAYAGATPEQRAVTAAVAVLERPASLGELSALSMVPDVAEAVDRAVDGRLLRRTTRGGERLVDAAHALVRSAITECLAFTDARTLHARAAEWAAHPVQAMRHRLLACGEHDPDLADEAVALADEQAGAGAWLASAQLLALAQRVLPRGPARNQLRIRAAEQLLRLGEMRWAGQLLADAEAEGGAQDAHGLFIAGQFALQTGDGERGIRAVTQVWELAEDPRLRVGAAELLAFLAADNGDGETAVEWAERALTAARTPTASFRFAGSALVAGWAMRGEPWRARPVLEEHMGRLRGTVSEADLRLALSIEALWRSDFAAAEEHLSVDGPADEFEALRRATSKVIRAELNLRTGRWDEVAALAQSEMLALDEGWDSRTASGSLSLGAIVLSARGHDEDAGAMLVRAEELLAGLPNVPTRIVMNTAQAWRSAMRADWQAVVDELAPLQDNPVTRRVPEGVYPWRGELAEALVALGRLDEADEVLAGPGASEGSAYGASGGLRARAAVAAARGALAEAEDHLRAALELDAGPVMEARAQLALGALLRRLGKRRAAVECLERARALNETLGVLAWEALIDRELGMTGLRPQAAGSEPALTPSEAEVSQLVVDGLTNREIADALSLSVKTVESHLTRVFAKMGVRHRVELARVLAEQQN